MNTGRFNNHEYVKFVNFSTAVLWMTKELSLPMFIINRIKRDGVMELRFIDQRKEEEWRFFAEQVLKEGRIKKVGQEEQFYFPIKSAVIKKLTVPKSGPVGSLL